MEDGIMVSDIRNGKRVIGCADLLAVQGKEHLQRREDPRECVVEQQLLQHHVDADELLGLFLIENSVCDDSRQPSSSCGECGWKYVCEFQGERHDHDECERQGIELCELFCDILFQGYLLERCETIVVVDEQ